MSLKIGENQVFHAGGSGEWHVFELHLLGLLGARDITSL
jgi:hypothetical protein